MSGVIAMKSVSLRNGAADTLNFEPDAGPAMQRRVVDADFAGVEFIIFAVFSFGHIGHDNVGAALQGNNSSPRVERLHGGGGRNVDVRQQEAGQSHGF